ncbi:MAG TPA: hypothetical protein VMB81_25885 [Candidatus Sulfotelmatobacter sp.]|nr:hypothetical protein [Candidatus Sulfotelmatobacter sp.]
MTAFQRLSPGPTIPDLMQAEFQAWLRGRTNSVSRGCYFSAASLVLRTASILLRMGLIEPDLAGVAFRIASGLTEAGVRTWRRQTLANRQAG